MDVTTNVPFNESWLTIYENNTGNAFPELQTSPTYGKIEKNPLAVINEPIFRITSSTKQPTLAIFFLPMLLIFI